MGSQGGIGKSNNGTRGEKRSQEQQSTSLDRQGSIYDLTLDEIQRHLGDLGKPLSSMNLDELLKTVWTAESNHVSGGGVDFATQHYKQSRDLSKKTVDEVWHDIQQGQKSKSNERKVLGEMTLEDFLVKAGIVVEPIQKKSFGGTGSTIDPLAFSQQGLQQQGNWMHYQVPSVNQLGPRVFLPSQSAQQPISIGGNPMLDVAFPDTTAMAVSPTTLMGTLSDTQTPGRKRMVSGDVAEKHVERRQKRMIKNRESAARSRARKQAYTNELEIKVTRLEEENEKLKRQNDVEQLLPTVPLPEPKYQLRRTSSAPI